VPPLYPPEQGLPGVGTDPARREALWGGPRVQSKLRLLAAALANFRFYFRPVSGKRIELWHLHVFAGHAGVFANLDERIAAGGQYGPGQSLRRLPDRGPDAKPMPATSSLFCTATGRSRHRRKRCCDSRPARWTEPETVGSSGGGPVNYVFVAMGAAIAHRSRTHIFSTSARPRSWTKAHDYFENTASDRF
jgi:hypothetical protein